MLYTSRIFSPVVGGNKMKKEKIKAVFDDCSIDSVKIDGLT